MELFAPQAVPEEVNKLRVWLHLPASEVDKIKKIYYNPTQKKEACLDLYVHQHPCPSWQAVSKALLYGFDLDRQAGIVEKTYVKGT